MEIIDFDISKKKFFKSSQTGDNYSPFFFFFFAEWF